jgi:two-component system, OmpR family, KDP operon response regulator KdpE
MSRGACILIVDDEPTIRRLLRTSLKSHDYEVLEAETGADAVKRVQTDHPDAVVLDLGLPDMDGADVIRSIRSLSAVPIVVVTVRAGEQDKVEALDLGADDYVTKPFGINELLARLRTALRHRLHIEGTPSAYHNDGLSVDLVRRQVTHHGKPVHLSPKEYDLLSYLVRHAGKVVTHGQLLREVWGEPYGQEVQYLRVYVRQIRNKLEVDPGQPHFILTEPGVGYRMAEDESERRA